MSSSDDLTPIGVPALRALGVSASYSLGGRGPNVLHSVDLEVWSGQTVGIVGESGSGKSTLARVLVGQLPHTNGQVFLDGIDMGTLRGSARRTARRRIQLIPQDPYASLDPRMTIRRALYEAIAPQGRRPSEAAGRIASLLRTVALDPDVASRYPHEFSGGQRQRIAIARALAVEPQVIIADEVTSSLDSSVQAEILNLLRDIQARTGIATIFITHDLSVANYMCDEICVLYLGRIVERGSHRLLFQPDHPYSRLLVESIPGANLTPSGTNSEVTGVVEASAPTHPPSGCPFHPRCPNGPRVKEGRGRCITDRPMTTPRWPEVQGAGYRMTACHFPVGSTAADPDTHNEGAHPRGIHD